MVEKKDDKPSQSLNEATDFNINEHREMTILDYYTNPYGKGSTFVNVKKMKEDFELRYDKMLANEHTKLVSKVYRRGRKDKAEFFILVRIPSESIRDLYYEVVVQLLPTKETIHAKTINNYRVRFFSNTPSFVFTFAYTYNIHNLIVEDCKPKFSKDSLRNSPIIRNQHNMVGLEKSVYYACHYIMNNLSDLDMLNRVAHEYNPKKFLELISDTDEKLQEYRVMQRIAKEKEAKEKSSSQVIRRTQKENEKYPKARTPRTEKSTGKSPITGRAKKAKVKGKKKLK